MTTHKDRAGRDHSQSERERTELAMTGGPAAGTASSASGTAGRTLSPGELAALHDAVATQNLLGLGTPAFTASSVLALMASLEALSAAYPQLVNPEFTGWVDQLYGLLAGSSTSYDQNFPALYLTWQVSQFPFDPASETVTVPNLGSVQVLLVVQDSLSPRWTSWADSIQVGGQKYGFYPGGVYPAFRNQCKINYTVQIMDESILFGNEYVQGAASREPWSPTAQPPAWNQALTSLMQSWGPAGCPANVFPPGTFVGYAARHLAVLDPGSWTDAEATKTAVQQVWDAQLAELRALAADSGPLTAQTCLYLLYLLLAVRSGDSECQAAVKELMNLGCSTPGHPNDIVGNQLVYAALMGVSDPAGTFAWTYPQRLQLLQDLQQLAAGDDPAAQALTSSLTAALRLQQVDSSYPEQDPNDSTNFDERKADTVAALRASLTGWQKQSA